MSTVQQTDIDEWLQEGLRHYAMSDPARALEAWYRVLDVEPKNARALEYIGYVRKNFRVEVKHPALEPFDEAAVPPVQTAAAAPVAEQPAPGENADAGEEAPAPPPLEVPAMPEPSAENIAAPGSDVTLPEAVAADDEAPAPPPLDVPTMPEPPANGASMAGQPAGDAALVATPATEDDAPAPPPLDEPAMPEPPPADTDAAAEAAGEASGGVALAAPEGAGDAPPNAEAPAQPAPKPPTAPGSSWGALVGAALGQEAPTPIDTRAKPEPPPPAAVEPDAPVAQAPVEQAPVAQAPVEQAPVAQAPVEQAPVAQAPVDDAPVEAEVGDDAVIETADASGEDEAEVSDDAVVESSELEVGDAEVADDAVLETADAEAEVSDAAVVESQDVSAGDDEAGEPAKAAGDDVAEAGVAEAGAPQPNVAAAGPDSGGGTAANAAPLNEDIVLTPVEAAPSDDAGAANDNASDAKEDASDAKEDASDAKEDASGAKEDAPKQEEAQIGLVGSAFGDAPTSDAVTVTDAPSVPDAITIPPVTVDEAPKVVRYQTYDDDEPATAAAPDASARIEDAVVSGPGVVDTDPPEPATAPTPSVAVDPAPPAASMRFEDLATPSFEEPATVPPPSEQPAPDPEPAEAIKPAADVFEIWGSDEAVVDLAETPVGPSVFDELLTGPPEPAEETAAPVEPAATAPSPNAVIEEPTTDPEAVETVELERPPSVGASEDVDTAEAPDVNQECETLMVGARELFALGDFSGSLELVEKALSLDADNIEANAYLDKNKATLLNMYESRLGNLEKAPNQLTTPDEVMWMNLHHRAGFMLSQVDGMLSYEDLAAVSGMSRFETFRILAELKQNGVID